MMNGNLMYEMAKSRIAEQEQRAIAAGEARRQRAEARGRHRKSREAEPVTPSIPDYAEELLEAGRNTVPGPREEMPQGRHSRSGR